MEFLKILWDNLKKGPVTDPFPFGETYTPERLRGRVEIDPDLCLGCGTCVHVCAVGAINISKFADGSGFEITVWRNSCCLCAQCRHYCPTKAITLSNDWHSAHRATEKYTQITRAKVKYDYCAVCGAKMRVLPQDVQNRIYAKHSEIDADVVSHLCPNCRRIDVAVIEDRACHIDQLEKMAANQEVCLVPPQKAEKKAAPAPKGEATPPQAKAPATPGVPDAAPAPHSPHPAGAKDAATPSPAPDAKSTEGSAPKTAKADGAAQAPAAEPQPAPGAKEKPSGGPGKANVPAETENGAARPADAGAPEARAEEKPAD